MVVRTGLGVGLHSDWGQGCKLGLVECIYGSYSEIGAVVAATRRLRAGYSVLQPGPGAKWPPKRALS